MKPIVDKKYKLEKFAGKGGWTYVPLPGIKITKQNAFGWVKVCGTIDGYEINNFSLMPMSEGVLMLAVKAEIRKAIGKQEGDTVHVILYPDDRPLEIPGELLLCLSDEPRALQFFEKLSDSEKKFYVQWIYSAKREETKVNRMATTIDRLTRGLKMYDKVDE